MSETRNGFQSLSLTPQILAVLKRANYHQPTPIQAAFIPEALDGRDVIGQAQTGTGKTAAFLLPFWNGFETSKNGEPQAIVLAPTRELVVQVSEEAKKLAPRRQCRVLAVYGGRRFRDQADALRKGVDLVVGTPGRVLDHLRRRTLSLRGVHYLVLDEADRMLDIGFRPDIERILRHCPDERQTMLLSATMPAPVLRLTRRYMVDPVHVNLSPEKPAVEDIRQTYITVDEDRKLALLTRLLNREKPRQCIIFCETKRGAAQLQRQLETKCSSPGVVAVMQGDMLQEQRNRIMKRFREGKVRFLVATDVVGRGIDVLGISHIINYDIPRDPESYVHRIGRTGRMGAGGAAITFVTPDEGKELTAVEGFVNMIIQPDSIEGFQSFAERPEEKPDTPPSAKPVFGRRVRRRSRRL